MSHKTSGRTALRDTRQIIDYPTNAVCTVNNLIRYRELRDAGHPEIFAPTDGTELESQEACELNLSEHLLPDDREKDRVDPI